MASHQHHGRFSQGSRHQRSASSQVSSAMSPGGGGSGGAGKEQREQRLPAGLGVNTADARAKAPLPDANEVSPLTDEDEHVRPGRQADQLSVSSRSGSIISFGPPDEDSACTSSAMTDRTTPSSVTSSGASTLFAGLGGGIARLTRGGGSATSSPATPTSAGEAFGNLNVKGGGGGGGGGGHEPSPIMDAQSLSLRHSQSSSSGLGIIREDRNKGQQGHQQQQQQRLVQKMDGGKAPRQAPIVPPPASLRRGDSNGSNTIQPPGFEPLGFEPPTGRTSGPTAGFTITTVSAGAAAGPIPAIMSLAPPSTASSSSSTSAAAMEAAAAARFRAQTLGSSTVISSAILDDKQQQQQHQQRMAAAAAAAKQGRISSLFSRLRHRGGSAGGQDGGDFLVKRSLTPLELSQAAAAAAAASGGGRPGGMGSPSSGEEFPAGVLPESLSRNSSLSLPSPRLYSSGGRSEPVFGVSLDDSLNVAGYRVRVSHRGKSTSHRMLPISVYKCCEFLQRNSASHLVFAAPGDTGRVRQLLEVFSSLPDYGESFEFSPSVEGDFPYSVADAARVVTVFLERLPKPAVPASAAKLWVRLARQEGALDPSTASGSGSGASSTRGGGGGGGSSAAVLAGIEFSGIDMWTEAMSRLPAAARNLVKHLLNLWADLARAADGATDASTRQIAASVARAMFQFGAGGGTKTQQQTLALAWLIKKRAEYAGAVEGAVGAVGRGGGGSGKLDGSKTTLALPTNKEMLDWRFDSGGKDGGP